MENFVYRRSDWRTLLKDNAFSPIAWETFFEGCIREVRYWLYYRLCLVERYNK